MKKPIYGNVFLLITLLFAFGGIDPPLAIGSGTLRVAIPTDLTNLDLHKTTAQIDNWLLGSTVYEKLFSYDQNLNIKPQLAEKYTISSDGLAIIIDLRKGVLFHDASEMTADDVKFSIERVMSRELPGVHNTNLENVKAVKISGPYQVTIELKEPAANIVMFYLATTAGSTAIMPKKALEASGNKVVQPIGTGPYKFSSWEKDSKVTLERFDKYTKDKRTLSGDTGTKSAYSQKIVFMVMKEPTTRIMALERADVDLAGFLPYHQIEELMKRMDMTVYSELAADTRFNLFFLGFKNPWLAKKDFRKALALALDRDDITKAAVWGQGAPSFSIILPLHSAYSKELEKMMPYDPEKAKQLIKSTGYNGESLTITASKNYSQMYDQAVAAQAMWAAVGINTKIEVVDWATVLERWKKGEHDILSFAMIGRTEPWAQTWAMSDKNFYGYKNQKVDDLRQSLLKTTDQQEINKIYRMIQSVQIEDVPFLINFYINTNFAVSPKLKNFDKFDLFIPRWWNMEVGS